MKGYVYYIFLGAFSKFSHLFLTGETKFNCKQPIEIRAMTCAKIMKPTKVKYSTTKQYRFNQDILQRETVIPRVITTQQFKCTETNTYICLHTHTYTQRHYEMTYRKPQGVKVIKKGFV